MIKKGDTVKVYVDPLTCKELEFAGTVTKIVQRYGDNLTLYCEVKDEYGDKFNRKININNH